MTQVRREGARYAIVSVRAGPRQPFHLLSQGVEPRRNDLAISRFADLLDEARRQPEPQRLLFVFTRAELPDNPSAEQRRRFEQGEGGVLTPVLCVDKTPDELSDMEALVAESQRTEIDWDIVFVGALSAAMARQRLTTSSSGSCSAWWNRCRWGTCRASWHSIARAKRLPCNERWPPPYGGSAAPHRAGLLQPWPHSILDYRLTRLR
ncbi:hypothetical protein ACOJCM_04400 [Billgrantia sp. LNSP4103-1]|uniref:hypothetical protein n=1 Tax=Billgrantia sp. LNSP4103-1 TaxID=3410266 RepID=UPI00403F40A7